jgi:pyruvate/2-oxoglutarate dehydrogenase complex dihydrolipoamide dehydrogenase (E3) component
MATTEFYENIIVGSGEAGKFLAWHLARQGRPTAIVERRWIGGSCPNVNCLPSKNEVWSARVIHLVRNAFKYGVDTPAIRVDMARVLKRKKEMVEAQIKKHLQLFNESGAELIMGTARFVSSKTLEVQTNEGGTRTLEGERIFLNLGSHAVIPNIPGLMAAKPLTNIEALELATLPEHLVVLGGSYVGLEFAQAYRRFGARVTVIEQGPRLIGHEDPDVSAEIAEILQDEGIETLPSAELLGVAGRSGETVTLRVRCAAGERTITGSHILVAAGRTANTDDVGLDRAGVEIDRRGYIVVDNRLRTTAPSVWAMGDCAGSPQFTHVSHDDFRVVRDNLDGKDHRTSGRLIPYCMFMDPPLAHVGLSETDAMRRGLAVRVAKVPLNVVLRTSTTGETQGFMKTVIGAENDKILGFTMIGAEAGEVVAAVQTAMLGNLPYDGLRDAIIAHPTMAEGLGQLLANVPAQVPSEAP